MTKKKKNTKKEKKLDLNFMYYIFFEKYKIK